MRLLGIDFGQRRIGVAVAESEHGIATPRPNLTASGSLARDAEAIGQLAEREEVDLIVVGVPMRGEDEPESKQTRVCGMLAERLAAIGWRVEIVDESTTTLEATKSLRADLTAAQRRKVVDGEAACLILLRFLAKHPK